MPSNPNHSFGHSKLRRAAAGTLIGLAVAAPFVAKYSQEIGGKPDTAQTEAMREIGKQTGAVDIDAAAINRVVAVEAKRKRVNEQVAEELAGLPGKFRQAQERETANLWIEETKKPDGETVTEYVYAWKTSRGTYDRLVFYTRTQNGGEELPPHLIYTIQDAEAPRYSENEKAGKFTSVEPMEEANGAASFQLEIGDTQDYRADFRFYTGVGKPENLAGSYDGGQEATAALKDFTDLVKALTPPTSDPVIN